MPRRGENIYRRRDGRWEGRYIAGRKPDGAARYRSVYAASYQEVRRRLGEEKAALLSRQAVSCRLTVNVLCARWLESVRDGVKPSSYARYALLVRRHLLPELGALRPEKLTAKRLSAFVSGKLREGRVDGRGGLSPKTVQDIVVVLKAVLKLAGLEYGVPPVPLKAPKVPRPQARVLPDADAAALEAGLRGSGGGIGVLLSLYTGLRLGEVCAARWSDIDWREGFLHVRRTAARLPRGDGGGAKTALTVASPKTARAGRAVPLPRALAEELKKRAAGQAPDAYILTGQTGRCMDPRTYQYRFRRALERLGIPPVNFHALRHTYATRCIREGVDIKTLSEILGHASVQMTLDRYVHSSPEAKKRQLENLRFAAP